MVLPAASRPTEKTLKVPSDEQYHDEDIFPRKIWKITRNENPGSRIYHRTPMTEIWNGEKALKIKNRYGTSFFKFFAHNHQS